MSLKAVRITSGKDLKHAIAEFAAQEKIAAGAIVSAVGSLSKAKFRMAGAKPNKQDLREYEGHFEIVSLIGTIAQGGGMHMHMAISDDEGKVIGGHLKDGCITHTTVELVIVVDEKLKFKRELDPTTGFDELKVETA